jgi:hypothetical protein
LVLAHGNKGAEKGEEKEVLAAPDAQSMRPDNVQRRW